jgi:heptosyltransferase III
VASVLEGLPHAGRVGIIRLRSLGDCVLTTPALDILKRFRPDLRVAVAVEDRFRAIFEHNPDVDEILPPTPGPLRRWRPDLCVNFHGGTRSACMAAFSGARVRAGFGHFRHSFVYNLRIPRAQEILGEERTVHTAEHMASAIFHLGAPRCEIPRAKLVTSGAAPSRAPVCVIHAVAATADKTWPSDGFVAVAGHVKRQGLEPVFIGAKADDLSPFGAYRIVRGAPLDEIKTLLSGAALFVGNDSGPAHMAAASGAPVVVIFGNSNPDIWGPWRTDSQVVRAEGGIAMVQIAAVLDALGKVRVAV